jgi:methionyl-tRNA formyltransferase
VPSWLKGTGAPGSVLAVPPDGVLVACGEGALRLTELQRAGGKRLRAADFLRGVPVATGERLQ